MAEETKKSELKAISGKKIFKNSPLPTFVIDSDGFVTMVNQAFIKTYDLPDKDIMIDTNALTEPSNIEHTVVKYMEEALEGKVVETPEVDFVTPHGVRRITKSRLFPLYDEDDEVTHVVVMHENITDRRLAEDEVFKIRKEAAVAKERADIIESIPEIIFILNEDLKLLDWNNTAEKRTSFDPEDIEQKHIQEFLNEKDREKIKRFLEEAFKNGYASEEGRLLTKQDEDIVHSWHASAKKYEDEGSCKILMIGIDITERKEAEERERFLNSLLRHDVKNKLQIAQGYLKLAEDLGLQEKIQEFFDKSIKANREAIEIINKVKNIHDVRKEKIESIEINSIIEDVVEENFSNARFNQMDIDVELSHEDIRVKGGMLLKELFTNLINNSIKHSEGDRIVIRCEESKEEVVFTLEDDGKGIPDYEKKKIFERGYTTNSEWGTGLGLFLVKILLDSYDGNIEVKDSDLGGARFDIYLKKDVT